MIITLLSDFGFKDNFLAVAKAILLEQLPDAHMIDINHEVEPFHLLQCSYQWVSAYESFPARTIHLSLFDIMQQRPAALLVAAVGNQYFISADNGLLPLSFKDKEMQVKAMGHSAASYGEWIAMAAGVIRQLQQADFDLSAFPDASPKVFPLQLQPVVKEHYVECQVIHIDRYENVVLNITRSEFDLLRKGRKFRISFMRNESVTKISQHYADVAQGEKLCLFNSAGFLEIAINRGNAASLLGFRLHDDTQLIYQHIKIEFL